MKNIKIDIWSDIVCPFCFIGKKKLEQAISKLQLSEQVEIEWHSFQLDPDFPKGEAIPSSTYLAQRKNYPIEQINAIQQQLTGSNFLTWSAPVGLNRLQITAKSKGISGGVILLPADGGIGSSYIPMNNGANLETAAEPIADAKVISRG